MNSYKHSVCPTVKTTALYTRAIRIRSRPEDTLDLFTVFTYFKVEINQSERCPRVSHSKLGRVPFRGGAFSRYRRTFRGVSTRISREPIVESFYTFFFKRNVPLPTTFFGRPAKCVHVFILKFPIQSHLEMARHVYGNGEKFTWTCGRRQCTNVPYSAIPADVARFENSKTTQTQVSRVSEWRSAVVGGRLRSDKRTNKRAESRRRTVRTYWEGIQRRGLGKFDAGKNRSGGMKRRATPVTEQRNQLRRWKNHFCSFYFRNTRQ